MKRILFLSLSILIFVTGLYAQEGKFRTVREPIPNRYIVVLKDVPDALRNALETEMKAANLNAKYGGDLKKVFSSAISGYLAEMSPRQARQTAQDPEVLFVEEDGIVTIAQSAPVGLDRIDQRSLPLSGTYSTGSHGSGVHAYILDTGIRISHNDFGGRASVSYDALNDGHNGIDCHGHGTMVAGIVGGTTYGVANAVSLHSVRVADCNGDATFSNIISGLDWVKNNRSNPAVVNISLGDGGGSSSLDTAVNNAVGSGVTVVVAAGNLDESACNHSPARVSSAITVAATATDDSRLVGKNFASNFGSCVDLFAPGGDILTTAFTSDSDTVTASGTSFASPHVAGVVAQLLSSFSGVTTSEADSIVKGLATPGVVSNAGSGSPNLLLFTRFATYSGTSISSNSGGCYYTSTVTAGDGVFTAQFPAGYGGSPNLTIEKQNGGGWTTVGYVSGTFLRAGGAAGSYRMKACVSSGGGYGWFVAVFNYPVP
jgi:subtilisin family serine protease